MRRLRIWLAMKLLPADVQVANNLTIRGDLNLYVPNSQLTGCTFESEPCFTTGTSFITLGDKG